MTARKWIYAGLAGIPLLLGAAIFLRMSDDGLAGVHNTIELSIPEVTHISADQFAQNDPSSMIVFDTREPEEFAVSRLPGSTRIAPDMPVAKFLAEFGPLVKGKKVVFYCSVGVRSSQYAAQVQDALKAQGAMSVANLERGIFGWHNDGRPLVSKGGHETKVIHPYDEYWGKLIERNWLISNPSK